MDLQWDEPRNVSNYCHTAKAPLISYWISNEDGGAHLGCEYHNSNADDDHLASFYPSAVFSAIEQAKDFARQHYARMIYPDPVLVDFYFPPLQKSSN